MTKLENSKFVNLLPPNLQGIKENCLSAALDRQTKELVHFAARVLFIQADILHISEELADHLAIAFAIRAYKQELRLEQKRYLVQNALLNYARLGTANAVEDVATAIYGGTTILENWEYNGAAYHFKIKVDASHEIPTGDPNKELLETVTEYKNVRSWIDGISIEMFGERTIHTAALGEVGSFLVGYPTQERGAVQAASLHTAVVATQSQLAISYPKQERDITEPCTVLTRVFPMTGAKLWGGSNF